MSLLVFTGVFLIGDPVEMLVADDADEYDREMVIKNLGLDQPFHIQYWRFLVNALQGNLGESFVFEEPALLLIVDRVPATLELAVCALLIAVVLGIPLGMWAGLRPESLSSKSIMTGSILGFSLPTFWVGIMMILLFAVTLGWLPSTGRGPTEEFFGIEVSFLSGKGLSYLILPAVNLSLFKLSMVIRLSRAGTREVIHQDYIKFARAKGVGRSRIVLIHVMKNIMIPVVTVLGLEFGGLVAFSVVTETVFAWPGMGQLILQAVLREDIPVAMATFSFLGIFALVAHFLADISYAYLDPRIRIKSQG